MTVSTLMIVTFVAVALMATTMLRPIGVNDPFQI